MFFTVTDKMSGRKKVLNASHIYSVAQTADGVGAIIKFNEGGDRAKMVQTVESYESICRALFPVIPESSNDEENS